MSTFVIRKKQFDAFKVPLRKKAREKIMAELKQKNIGHVYENGRDLIVEDSKGNKTTLNFSTDFIAESITKPSALKYQFQYDEYDRLTKLVLPDNGSIGWSYNNDLVESISLNNNSILSKYDAQKRLIEIIFPDNKKQIITYNLSGQVETIINRSNEIKKFETTLKTNQITYAIKDSLSKITKIEINPFGSGDKIIFPNGQYEETLYDPTTDAYITTLRNGSKRKTYYSNLKPKLVEWEDGNFLKIELNNRQDVQSLENPSGTIMYLYDSKGRIITEDFQNNRILYDYDENGLIREMTYPTGFIVKYNYNEDGKLKSIDTGNNQCTFKYLANGVK